MRRYTESTATKLIGSPASKSPLKVQRSGLAAGFGIEKLESRQMLANIVWDGGPAGTGTDFNLAANWVGDVLPAAADTATINTAGPTITVGASRSVTSVDSSREIRFNAGTFTTTGTSSMTASITMAGGTLSGGTWNFSGPGNAVRTTPNGGTLSNLAVGGDIFLDNNSADVLLSGTTSFTAARLTAANVTLQMAPGYTLNSLVVAEGAATGVRNITMAVGGNGTITFGPSAIVRHAAGTGAGLTFNNSSQATLINNGLISAEATGQILLINNTALTNNGTLAVSTGTLRINTTTWTNPGTLSGTGGTLQLDGTLVATAGIGTLNTAGANVLIAGAITNTGNTIQLNATSGSFSMFGGSITGGTINFAGGTSLRTTTTGGTLASVALNGDLLLNVSSADVLLSGTTSFTAARLTAANVTLQMAPGYTLNSLVVAEGAATGVRNITMAVGGNGTITFGPSAIVRHAAGSGGGLNLNNSSQATLINNGLISAEATGQTLTIGNTSLANSGTIRALAGTVNLNNIFTNTGLLSGTTGNLNISGTLDNNSTTQTIDAAAGTWRLTTGTIVGGTINITSGFLRGTNSGGTINNVAINGDLTLDTTSANIVVIGTTTFTAARLSGNNATLGLAPGYILNSLVIAEGPTAGQRNLSHAVGGVGTNTYGPNAVVRVAAGSGAGLSISNNSAATLINNGLISSEASGQTININVTSFTNNNILRTMGGGRITIAQTSWSNAATLDIQNGEINISGSGTFTNSGTISLGAGGLLTVATSQGLVLTSSSVVNTFIAGTANNQFGRIVVSAGDAALAGTLNIAFVDAYQPPIVSTFDILTVTQANRAIIGGFATTTMPPPGVDGKNFMFNDSRHIQFAFSSLADYNSDTVVDFFDYLDFVQDFSTQSGGADFNNDGVIDFFDYLDFLVIFSRF